MRLERELEAATRLALDVGAALRRHQAAALEVSYDTHGEPVTLADLEADAIIRDGLKGVFPDDVVFSEETADSLVRLSRPLVWIVDPLDSTGNFMEHGDEYSVSIGLSIEGRAALGVVYNPARNEVFAGYQGAGVTLNGSPVRVSDVSDLERARLAASRKQWRRLGNLATTLPIIPVAGMAYRLARVAAGLDDAVFSAEPRTQWGTCAGVALVLAGGGRASLLDGGEIRFNRPEPRHPLGMVASGRGLHRLLLETLGDLLLPDSCPPNGLHP